MDPVHELGFQKREIENTNPTSMTEIGTQCGTHGSKTPHASRITAHYMVGCCEHPVALLTHSIHPCYHPAVHHMAK